MVNVDVSGDLPVSVTVVPTQFTGDLAKSGAYELSISKEGLRLKRLIKQVLLRSSVYFWPNRQPER